MIIETLKLVKDEHARRKHWDGWYPSWFGNLMVDPSVDVLEARWRPLMTISIAAHLALPLLLLSGYLSVAIVVGSIVHASYATLFPATLAHFSLVMISTYVVFVDPWAVASAFP